MTKLHPRPALVLAGLLAAGLPAAAKDAPGPVARHLAGLDFGPGIEHRLLIVHPVFAEVPATDAARDAAGRPRLALALTADTLAIGRPAAGSRSRLEVVDLASAPATFLPGDLVRTDRADYLVLRHAVADAGRTIDLAVARVSRETEPDAALAEATETGPAVPTTLRWLVVSDAKPAAILEAGLAAAADGGVTTPRRSPAEIPRSETLGKRIDDYRAALATIVKAREPPGRRVVGYAALIDGSPAALETFAGADDFRAAWPRVLEGLAVEAALVEKRLDIVGEDIPDSADPDRFLGAFKQVLLDFYAARPETRDLREKTVEEALRTSAAAASALVAPPDRVDHLVLVTDPAQRKAKKTGEELDPGVLAHKLRLTEAERRWLDRRLGGTPNAPPAPTPPR